MFQRIRHSRVLPSVVSALLAATLAGGVAGAVSSTKADATSITMCVSALGTRIRFVHTSTDCTPGEIVRTWNVQGERGERGARGPRGAAGPTGPSGAAGASASTFSGGVANDTAQAVTWYVGAAASPSTAAVASSTFTVPGSARQYFVYWTSTETIPTVAASCTDDASNVTPTVDIAVNGVTTAIPEATLTPVVLPAGSNTIAVRTNQGRCAAGTVEAGATSNVTNARLSVIMG